MKEFFSRLFTAVLALVGVVVLVGAGYFLNASAQNRYAVSPLGGTSYVVLDTQTGNAWEGVAGKEELMPRKYDYTISLGAKPIHITTVHPVSDDQIKAALKKALNGIKDQKAPEGPQAAPKAPRDGRGPKALQAPRAMTPPPAPTPAPAAVNAPTAAPETAPEK